MDKDPAKQYVLCDLKRWRIETKRLATEMEDQLEQNEMLQTGSPTGNADAGVTGVQ